MHNMKERKKAHGKRGVKVLFPMFRHGLVSGLLGSGSGGAGRALAGRVVAGRVGVGQGGRDPWGDTFRD